MLELANHIVAASRQSADDHAKNPSIQSSSVDSVSSVNSVLKNSEPETVNPEPAIADILENLELQLEHAQSMAEGSPNVFLKASMNIAAMEMFSVLHRFDTVTLSKRLKEKPELYFRVLNSQCALLEAHLDQQKFEFKKKQAKAKQRDRQQKLRARKPILITTGTLDTLDQTLHRSRRREEAEQCASPAAEELPHSEPRTLNRERSVTSNTGSTDTTDVVYQEVQPNPIVAASRQSAADQPPINHGRPVADGPLTTDNCRLITAICADSQSSSVNSVNSVNSVVKDPEPQTLNSEPCFEPAWSDPPPEAMVCCPS